LSLFRHFLKKIHEIFGLGVPGKSAEMFYLLQENGFLPADLTQKMVKAAGFRNLLVHEYEKIDLQRLHHAAENNVDDLTEFLAAVFKKLGIA
jgi:uncharacterized protein YutE (UPF0331/DUF86 family)